MHPPARLDPPRLVQIECDMGLSAPLIHMHMELTPFGHRQHVCYFFDHPHPHAYGIDTLWPETACMLLL